MSRKHFKRLFSRPFIIWKKTGLNAYVYFFSVDYDAISVDDVLGIHKYLMKKNDCMLLSCHVQVSQWIYTPEFAWMPRNSLLEPGAISKI